MPREDDVVSNETIDESRKLDLRAKYPYIEETKGEHKIGFSENVIHWTKDIKDKITSYTSTVLPCYDKVFECYRKYNGSMDWNYNIVSGINDNAVLKLDNGYFSYACEETNADELNNIAIKLKKFTEFLDEDRINFYYINGGYKVLEEEKSLPSYNEKFENADHNGNILMDLLRKQGIHVLDIREEAKKENKNWYSLFYKYDHHMKTDSQLWVAKKIAELLTVKEGYKFNKNIFSLSEYNLEKSSTMLGSQARTILKGGDILELEEYTKVIPRFTTSFEFELPTKGKIITGDYENSLFDNSVYKKMLQTDSYSINYPNGYSCATWRNYDLGIIRNKIPNFNKGKKVLILQDSFGCYTSTYFAQGIEELHLVYLPEFAGSIKSYIKDIKPDVVLMLYNEGVANKFEASTEGKFFNLS